MPRKKRKSPAKTWTAADLPDHTRHRNRRVLGLDGPQGGQPGPPKKKGHSRKSGNKCSVYGINFDSETERAAYLALSENSPVIAHGAIVISAKTTPTGKQSYTRIEPDFLQVLATHPDGTAHVRFIDAKGRREGTLFAERDWQQKRKHLWDKFGIWIFKCDHSGNVEE